MDITPAAIRDASFALTPTGCNPVQVEETLAKIAEHLTNGEIIPAELLNVQFDTVSAGFDPNEVADFFTTLEQTVITSTATPAATTTDEPVDEPADVDPDHSAAVVPTPSEDCAANTPDGEGESPRTVDGHPHLTSNPGASAPVRPVATTTPAIASGLPGAVERTKQAVSELESFVIQQMEEAKAALRLHIDQTQTDCLNTLDTARTISDQALDTARQRAEVMLDVATRTTNQLRDRFESEIASLRSAFEEDLTRRHSAIRADLEALVAEAKDLTEEAHAQLAEVHDDVRASLQDARSILTNPARRLAA